MRSHFIEPYKLHRLHKRVFQLVELTSVSIYILPQSNSNLEGRIRRENINGYVYKHNRCIPGVYFTTLFNEPMSQSEHRWVSCICGSFSLTLHLSPAKRDKQLFQYWKYVSFIQFHPSIKPSYLLQGLTEETAITL